jgi:predicted small lipoprotein YifL
VSIRRQPASSLCIVLLALMAACGKKGPPLEPLRLIPGPVAEPSARRSAQEVELRFALPTANANGAEAIDLDRVEVYAITVGPGSVTPPNRDILTKARVVGTIAVRPPLEEGEPEPPPTDTRPAPGDRVTFVETLSEDALKPVELPQVKPTGTEPAPAGTEPAPATEPKPTGTEPKPASTESKPTGTESKPAGADRNPAGTEPPPKGAEAKKTPGQEPGAPAADPKAGLPPAIAPPAGITELTRIYLVRGLSRAGRPGPPSARLSVPLASPVGPPSAVAAQMPSETAISIEWTPAVAELGGTPLTYNVYRRETATTPLNQAPLTDAKFETRAGELGKEQCFIVRTIQASPNVTIESEPSSPACLTPVDRFPPAAPAGLRAVAEDGAVNLVWDQNSEADLGGYLVLRGEAPDALQPLTPKPIAEANYRDSSATPGVRYVYAVVAVDRATPYNPSAPSALEAVTAR